MKDNFMTEEYQEEDIQLRAILEKYLIHWQWFVLGILLCIAVAYVYLRYTTPQYQASTTILVKDEKKGGMLSELSAFADLGLGVSIKSNLDNEIEILKSRTLVERTVKKLDLNITMTVKGNVVDVEIYKDTPIKVNFINLKPSFYTDGIKLEFLKLTPNTFELKNGLEEVKSPIVSNKRNLDTVKSFPPGTVI